MILLLGATGYVGQAFKRQLNALNIPVRELSGLEILTNGKGVLQTCIREIKPSFLINAAGFTGKPNVETCEHKKAGTISGNVVLPLMIGEVCAEEGLPWGHVSSGCIYNGQRGTDEKGETAGFREEDEPNFDFHHPPCSFYSGTKSMAEHLLADFPTLYIWRMRVPFDEWDGPRNYLSKLMRYACLLDVRNSLSHRGDFVQASLACYERKLPYGVYNLTCHGSITTQEVVKLIEEEGDRREKSGDFFSTRQMKKKYEFFTSESEFALRVDKTPRSSCVLDTEKARRAELPLREVRAALSDALRSWIWEHSV